MGDPVKREGLEPNSPTKEDDANPPGTGNAKQQPDPNQMDAKVVELSEKVEKLTQQYTGSSEEALRLKEERDKLALKVAELEVQVSSSRDLDRSLQTDGDQNPIAAIDKIVESRVADLTKKVDALLGDHSKNVFNTFKNEHPGLDGDVLVAFNTKLEQLKRIYTDPVSAMKDAYKLVGGLEADVKAREAAGKGQQTVDAQQQSQQQQENVVNQVVENGSNQDRNSLNNQPTDLENKLNILKSQHLQNSLMGRTDIPLMVEIKKLQAQIKGLTK